MSPIIRERLAGITILFVVAMGSIKNSLLTRVHWAVTASFLLMMAWGVPRSGYAQSDWQQDMIKINPNIGAPFAIDERMTTAAGIRKISGQHIDLFTDVPTSPEVDELVDVFDHAIKPWCDYFEIAPETATPWKIRVFLIADAKNPNRFRKSGLMPSELPDFPAGFQRGHDIWIFHQPGKYYTRHLLIHEGTHSFMQWFLNGYGAPWYAEGIAELLGVHRWNDQELTMGYRLTDRAEAEYWGRVKGIIDDREADQAMTLTDVLNIPTNAFREVRYYGWSWAGCEFFSKHEKTKAAFTDLKQGVSNEPQLFNQNLQPPLQPIGKCLNGTGSSLWPRLTTVIRSDGDGFRSQNPERDLISTSNPIKAGK